MTSSRPPRTLALLDVFPARQVSVDGEFACLDECTTETSGSLVYCQDLRFLKIALANDRVGALLVPPRLASEVQGRAFAVVDDPRLEFFRLYKRLCEEGFLHAGLEAGRGVDCTIHPSAVVSDEIVLGDRVTIGPGALILGGSSIGDDSFIAPGAIVGTDGLITVDDGEGRLRIPHAGGVRIGRNVQVLSRAVIARSLFRRFTSIGDHAQIGIQATVGHGVQIGRRCIIRGNSVISGRAIIEDDAIVSLASCVADAKTVGAEAEIKMGSVVVSDVPAGETVSGNFAYAHRRHVNDWIRRSR